MIAVTRLRVTCLAIDSNRYILRVGIDLDLEAIAVRRGSVRWEQSKKRNLVLARNMTGLSHISSLSVLSASLSISSSHSGPPRCVGRAARICRACRR